MFQVTRPEQLLIGMFSAGTRLLILCISIFIYKITWPLRVLSLVDKCG